MCCAANPSLLCLAMKLRAAFLIFCKSVSIIFSGGCEGVALSKPLAAWSIAEGPDLTVIIRLLFKVCLL